MAKFDTICDLEQCSLIGQTCAVFNLRKASRAVTKFYEEIMKPSGILPTQFTLLVVTRAFGPITISSMAELLVMDRTTLTRNLKPLEREGLLLVVPGKNDKRSREVSLTNKGLEHLEEALPLWQEAQSRIEQALGSLRLDRMLDDLTAVVSAAGSS
ncbi:MAG: winged helix-turn-helix transcriptional regulator [gamma proteobacterium endosymbiont of Lamellibrachia anaximandri]|nr:winged helix-turn-helix transcriptional regulator [gamma proteobacterium endosymbiont of Lamellibrachia anaximandri]MBL3535719.1 winged helix-turn-helix transcriptional regulator [gamma proteobacterium endosymbiont of Lamellibrachia anaximandri]